MTNSNVLSFDRHHVAARPVPSAPTPDAIVRGRVRIAVALTGLTLAIALALGIAFGATGIVLFALPLPVPLTLLWLSADVLRADERAETDMRAR